MTRSSAKLPVQGGDRSGGSVGSTEAAVELVHHLAWALVGHLRRQRELGRYVPREVRDIAIYLARVVSTRLDPPSDAAGTDGEHAAPVTDQLLVTKEEAAKRLSVSVRTVERLAATGRLPQVHIDRAVRFRVRDLHLYVENLPVGPTDTAGE